MTRLLAAEEVADRLDLTKEWVWAAARAGRIPHVQLGRYRRFREESLGAGWRSLKHGAPRNGRAVRH
jgi:excisionase family DNA binding protein